MRTRFFLCIGMIGLTASCLRNKAEHDASGIFEATEVTVLAETSGRLAELDIKKGAKLTAGQAVGYVDSALLYLKKMQLTAAQRAMAARDEDISVYSAEMEQVNDLLAKCRIVNPVEGVVLGKYVEAMDMVATGTPLYRIADTKQLFLLAYIVSERREYLQTGKKARVYLTQNNTEKVFEGTVAWISDKAEPVQNTDKGKTSAYAVKIAVDNPDGTLKAGMRGGVDFSK